MIATVYGSSPEAQPMLQHRSSFSPRATIIRLSSGSTTSSKYWNAALSR